MKIKKKLLIASYLLFIGCLYGQDLSLKANTFLNTLQDDLKSKTVFEIDEDGFVNAAGEPDPPSALEGLRLNVSGNTSGSSLIDSFTVGEGAGQFVANLGSGLFSAFRPASTPLNITYLRKL